MQRKGGCCSRASSPQSVAYIVYLQVRWVHHHRPSNFEIPSRSKHVCHLLAAITTTFLLDRSSVPPSFFPTSRLLQALSKTVLRKTMRWSRCGWYVSLFSTSRNLSQSFFAGCAPRHCSAGFHLSISTESRHRDSGITAQSSRRRRLRSKHPRVESAQMAGLPSREYECTRCFTNFYTHYGLRNHREFSHTENPSPGPYACSACGYRNRSAHGVRSHFGSCDERRLVTQICSTLYVCGACGTGFSTGRTLKRHLTSDECKESKTLEDMMDLEKHKYSCSVCEFRSHSEQLFEKHWEEHGLSGTSEVSQLNPAVAPQTGAERAVPHAASQAEQRVTVDPSTQGTNDMFQTPKTRPPKAPCLSAPVQMQPDGIDLYLQELQKQSGRETKQPSTETSSSVATSTQTSTMTSGYLQQHAEQQHVGPSAQGDVARHPINLDDYGGIFASGGPTGQWAESLFDQGMPSDPSTQHAVGPPQTRTSRSHCSQDVQQANYGFVDPAPAPQQQYDPFAYTDPCDGLQGYGGSQADLFPPTDSPFQQGAGPEQSAAASLPPGQAPGHYPAGYYGEDAPSELWEQYNL